MPLPAFTSSIDIDGSLASNITTQWVSPLVYTSTTDVDDALSSNIALSALPGSSYIYTDDVELSGNLIVSPVLFAYIANVDNTNFSGNVTNGIYSAGSTYTSSIDNQNFVSDLGGIYSAGATYTSSVDGENFVSNRVGVHIPFVYRDSLTGTQTLVGTKDQTYGYVDTINLLSSNLTGIKNTQALPVYIQFSSAIPNIRLNIPNNVPFLKQVFVE